MAGLYLQVSRVEPPVTMQQCATVRANMTPRNYSATCFSDWLVSTCVIARTNTITTQCVPRNCDFNLEAPRQHLAKWLHTITTTLFNQLLILLIAWLSIFQWHRWWYWRWFTLLQIFAFCLSWDLSGVASIDGQWQYFNISMTLLIRGWAKQETRNLFQKLLVLHNIMI